METFTSFYSTLLLVFFLWIDTALYGAAELL